MEFVEQTNIKEKNVILRLDLNVTIKNNNIIDDTKIRKSIKTIKYLLDNDNKILIMSHLGKIKTEEDKLNNSLKIVCDRLSSILNENINFIDETRGEDLENCFNYKISMMQNTRYEDLEGKKESSCDEELSKYWASLGDIFVNDAFGTTHRRHASNYGISKYLPTYYGYLIKEELDGLNPIIDIKNRPFTVIMGGAKVDDKVALISSLLKECDYLLVGGGIANTFIKAKGYNIGSSLYSEEYINDVKDIIDKYQDKILIPIDVVVNNNEVINIKNINDISDNDSIYDIGNKTIEHYKTILDKSSLVFINGTVGVCEDERYQSGTIGLFETLKNTNSIKIAGGGDALASIYKFKYEDSFNYISTGGGATLEYIATKKLACFEGDTK